MSGLHFPGSHCARSRRRAAPILLLLLTSCASPGTLNPTPSPSAASPSPTLPETTPEASATFAPLTDATPPIVLEPSSNFASPSPPLAPPVHLPDNSIALFEPGPGSQVISPFRAVGRAGPSFEERVIVRLFGEEDQLLLEKVTILFAYPGNAGRFVTIIPFETTQLAEAGRLQFDTLDRRYGRLAHRFSQDLVLLSQGPDRVRPGSQGPAQLAILEPNEGSVIRNGPLTVKGGGWSHGEGRLLLQAWDSSGGVIASAPLELSNGLEGSIGEFEAELLVDLASSQYGRLAVMEVDSASGEPRYLNSIEVLFSR